MRCFVWTVLGACAGPLPSGPFSEPPDGTSGGSIPTLPTEPGGGTVPEETTPPEPTPTGTTPTGTTTGGTTTGGTTTGGTTTGGTTPGGEVAGYPVRSAYQLKAIQPDFWADKDEISGNLAGGVGMNLVWAAWEPTVVAPPCDPLTQVDYDGHCFTTDVATDDAIADWHARGLLVTAIVYGTPAWAAVSPCSPLAAGYEIFCAPENAFDYARFVGMIAERYNGLNGRGRIADFVIQNEVNSNSWFDIGCGEGLGACDVGAWATAYADVYNQAFDAIVAAQPEARAYISLEHHFDEQWDLPADLHPLVGGQTFLTTLVPLLGDRVWRIAHHPYAPNLFSTVFSADDYRDEGKVTYGSVGVLSGWIAQQYPGHPAALSIHLTESGLHGGDEAAQDAALCDSFRNILGTPGIENHIYHRMVDNAAEGGLLLGLRRLDGSARPSWATWALANRWDVGLLSCGFEDIPFTRLTRSYSPARGHWSSTRLAPPGFSSESTYLLSRDLIVGGSLLYECLVGDGDMLTTDPSCEGQEPLGPVGWTWPDPTAGTIPLYRCITDGDHFISPDSGCEGQVTESLLGWVFAG